MLNLLAVVEQDTLLQALLSAGAGGITAIIIVWLFLTKLKGDFTRIHERIDDHLVELTRILEHQAEKHETLLRELVEATKRNGGS